MCFYRLEGSRAEYLNFFASGHFHHTSTTGAGGFAGGSAVYGTVRGNYGFQPNGVLATRIGYQGTGVSQTTRAPGRESRLDVSGQTALEREVILPNCQKITYRDEAQRVTLGMGRGAQAHPQHVVINGVRWESYTIDCPAWGGWIRD